MGPALRQAREEVGVANHDIRPEGSLHLRGQVSPHEALNRHFRQQLHEADETL